MAEKIWIVIGTTGEYSDRSEWVSVAFRSEEAAKAHVEALQKRYLELGGDGLYGLGYNNPKRDEAYAAMRELDPGFGSDYTGTDWFISECELKT